MNTKRAVFSMPEDHIIRITPNWLLGFTEGEGCFSVRKSSPFMLTFSLSQKNNTALLKAIQSFFNDLGVNNSSAYMRNQNKGVSGVSFDNRIASKGEISYLYITQENFITLALIPFFDSLHWYTKKEEDYKDWKLVLEIKKLGLHYVEKGIRVINLIISQMNLNRLSTNPAKISPCLPAKLKEDISELLSGASNLEVKDGKTLIKSLNKYYTGRGNKVDIRDKNGLLLYSFDSISKCAKFLGISGGTVSKRLVDNIPVIVGSKEFFISKPDIPPSLRDPAADP